LEIRFQYRRWTSGHFFVRRRPSRCRGRAESRPSGRKCDRHFVAGHRVGTIFRLIHRLNRFAPWAARARPRSSCKRWPVSTAPRPAFRVPSRPGTTRHSSRCSRRRSTREGYLDRGTSIRCIASGRPIPLARRNVGTPVFGGMILTSFVGILAIPPLYVMFQAMRERLRPSARPKELQAKSTTVRHVNPALITVQCMHIRLLRCGSPLVALRDGSLRCINSVAIGGTADIRRSRWLC
jgi:hypothetical protein